MTNRIRETVRFMKICLQSLKINGEKHRFEDEVKEERADPSNAPTTDEFTVNLTRHHVKTGKALEEKLKT